MFNIWSKNIIILLLFLLQDTCLLSMAASGSLLSNSPLIGSSQTLNDAGRNLNQAQGQYYGQACWEKCFSCVLGLMVSLKHLKLELTEQIKRRGEKVDESSHWSRDEHLRTKWNKTKNKKGKLVSNEVIFRKKPT